MQKSVPLSVRISDDDAAFLAKFEAPGANTPSEKLRAILSSARQRHEGTQDFAACATMIAEMLRPPANRIRTLQREAGIRSDFVMRIYGWMPDLMAELLSGAPDDEAGRQRLQAFEAALADQIFAMIEELLDMGLTSSNRSYDPRLVRDRITPILEILDLIKLRQEATGETK